MSLRLSPILESLRRARDWYYKTKYVLLARLLGRKDVEADLSRRGLLVIQIDGLSHEMLRRAMKKGYCPFLRRLIKRRFQLKRYNCGFPSNTPTAHAVLFYGDRDETPGFRWYEKESEYRINFFNPIDAGIVESRLNEKNEECLLSGGSGYANMFSGDADRAVLCYGSAVDTNIKRKLRGFQILLIMALNIIPILRAAVLSVREFCAEVFEWIVTAIKHLPQRVEFLFPITRMVEGVWLQEIVTQGALLEIVRGTPAIYVTYVSYDSNSHQRGCERSSTLRKLVSIDRRLRRIVRLAQRRILRTYDVYILSDHGQTPSEPFLYVYGEELEEYVRRVLDVAPGEDPPPIPDPPSFVSLVLRSIEPYEKSFVRGIQWVIRGFARFARRRAGSVTDSGAGPGELVVCPSGPMAHIYLPESGKLSDEEIQQRYPQLIPSLLKHPGIGVVATVSNGTVTLRSERGEAKVTEDEIVMRGGALRDYAEIHLNALDIHRVAVNRFAGDLMVFGSFHDGKIANYEHQMSAHGGVGGQQQSAFVMFPRHMPAPEEIGSFEDIREMMLRTRERH